MTPGEEEESTDQGPSHSNDDAKGKGTRRIYIPRSFEAPGWRIRLGHCCRLHPPVGFHHPGPGNVQLPLCRQVCLLPDNAHWAGGWSIWHCVKGKGSFVKKKRFFVKSLHKMVTPLPLLWSPYSFFFQRKKRLCGRVFEGCLKGVFTSECQKKLGWRSIWKNKLEVWNPSDPPRLRNYFIKNIFWN